MSERPLPLQGIRVIDLTVENGELAPRLLGDLGAEVIKIEPPTGSPARSLAPVRRGVSLSWAVNNAGKRSVVLDLDQPAEVDRLHELLRHADLIVCPAATAAPGVSVHDLVAAHPHLVVAALTPFGLTGPWSDWQVTDQVLSATGGMTFKAGTLDREPLPAPGQFCNDVAASSATWAMLCALWQREHTGAGQLLDISINECLAQTADWSLPNYTARVAAGSDFPELRMGSGPVYPIFRCRDGYVRLIVLSPAQWREMRAWLGEPEYLQDEEYDSFPGRFAIAEAILNPLYEELFADMSIEEVSAYAQDRGIVCTPVYDAPRALHNEHFDSRGTFRTMEIAPGVVAQMPSGYFEIDGERVGPSGPPPALGEHTDSVFASLGEARTGAPTPAPSLPLAGLRVMDFGQGAVGVEAGKLFAEYGAEVIKIESRSHYDFIRVVTGTEMGPSFASSSRSKKAIGVNAKYPEGRQVLLDLARHSDVVIENTTTGAMAALGIGYADLSAANPRLAMVASQLMGSRGVWAHWRGYGPSTQAPGGLSSLWSYEGSTDPAGTASIFPDHFVGRLSACGALATLIGRQRGVLEGALIEIAQCEAVVGAIADLLAAESVEPGSVLPMGLHTERGTPGANYRCAPDATSGTGAEEWVAITCRSDAEWQALAALIGQPELGSDDRFATLESRRRNVDELDALIAAWTIGLDRFTVAERCQAAGIPAGPMVTSLDMMNHPHFVERGFPVHIEQPGVVGPVIFEGPAFHATGMTEPVETPAPWLGEHTVAIATEVLGMDRARVDELIASGVLEITPPPA
ncbi:MAG: CoA transferase [Acidobacteria bacterium]|nr:CoA transferase [Acidobacteriota bacterium]